MKTTVRFIIFILMLGICFGCKTRHPYPQDFAFKIESETDIINSFDSTYLRSYREGDTVVKIEISIDELHEIFNEIKNNELDTYPENFIPECEVLVSPRFETKMQFRINGIYKNLTYKYDCQFPPITGFSKKRKYFKIEKSIRMIENIISSKPEVKRLSNTNWIFY